MNPDVQESTFFLALRRMRAPLITLILIYAISVLGLTLIPGIDAEGQPTRMSFFHAFYFISYTATTIGFGEIPNAFSESQRLWIILCIYLSVIGWAYSIGALLALLQDQNFQNAVRVQRFNRVVRHLREPFYLVCGYGETGQLLCRALDHLGIRAVVVEIEEARVSQLDLHGYSADIPALVADARQPEILKLAGLTHRCCLGVIALTNDDDANLAIAICARLLAPALPALCRAETAETATNMASFGTRHIINPFDKFGRYLALALNAPAAYHLLEWLTGVPGTLVVPHRDPPARPLAAMRLRPFRKSHGLGPGAGRRAGNHHRPRPTPRTTRNGTGCAATAPGYPPCWKPAFGTPWASPPAPATT
ncbi:potassium channel protein [Candidatus Competibacter phosphatis]|uniref:potassium channel protein n=1 Tax=Candidatus Competibacter phosphatis TaxID=221280 RepID=UPI0028A92A23|nr:NAD-binding protein [Candidatus Competibacter phosphatis]